MGARSKLEIGDIFRTKIGEIYVYIGYFKGTPRSFYKVSDEGYLYMFCSRKNEYQSRAAIEANIQGRALCGFDGNFCYTKQPKRFIEKIGHIDIVKINNIWNLVRIEK